MQCMPCIYGVYATAKRSSAKQESPCILWNPNVDYHILKSPLPVPIPSHSSWFDHPNNIWWEIQSITVLVRQSSPLSCYFISLRPEYLPQHPVLENPQPFFLPQCVTKFHTDIKQQAKLWFCISWYLHFWILNWKMKDFAPNDSKHSPISVWS